MSDNTGLSQGEKSLSKAADAVSRARSDLASRQSRLQSEIDELRTKWGGAGASAFQTLNTAWQEKQTRITNALNDFERSLVDTEKDNVNTDQSASDDIARRNARLNAI